MRESIKDQSRLLHIAEACRVLLERSKDDSLEAIQDDPIKFYGYVKLVEIIGEATYKLTKEFRADNPQVPWKMMEGMRHVLVHDYYCISPSKLWTTVMYDIPSLYPEIKKLIADSEHYNYLSMP